MVIHNNLDENPLLRTLKKIRVNLSLADTQKIRSKSLPCGHPKISTDLHLLAGIEKISSENLPKHTNLMLQYVHQHERMYMLEMRLLAAKRLREFRKDVLKLTLPELSRRSDIHVKTLYSFENGQSPNMTYLQVYFNQTDETNEQQYLDLVTQLLKDMKNGN